MASMRILICSSEALVPYLPTTMGIPKLLGERPPVTDGEGLQHIHHRHQTGQTVTQGQTGLEAGIMDNALAASAGYLNQRCSSVQQAELARGFAVGFTKKRGSTHS